MIFSQKLFSNNCKENHILHLKIDEVKVIWLTFTEIFDLRSTKENKIT